MQSLQVDIILALSPAVCCGTCGSQGFAWCHYDVAEFIIEPDFDHVVWLTVVLCAYLQHFFKVYSSWQDNNNNRDYVIDCILEQFHYAQ